MLSLCSEYMGGLQAAVLAFCCRTLLTQDRPEPLTRITMLLLPSDPVGALLSYALLAGSLLV